MFLHFLGYKTGHNIPCPIHIGFAQFEFLMGDNADNAVTFGVHASLLYEWPGHVGELRDKDFTKCVPFRHADGTWVSCWF